MGTSRQNDLIDPQLVVLLDGLSHFFVTADQSGARTRRWPQGPITLRCGRFNTTRGSGRATMRRR
jgi:hypothetical protein